MSALDWVRDQHHILAVLAPGMIPHLQLP